MAAITAALLGGSYVLWSRSADRPPAGPQQEQAPTGPVSARLEAFARGLTNPVALAVTGTAGDSRLFAVEQAGIIRIIQADGSLLPQPFLDIRNRIKSGGEQGLLGLAFDPDFARNGYFYVNYTSQTGVGDTVIARYHATGDVADPGSETVLLRQTQPFTNHNGGDLHFGPDGRLYAGLGDGGGAGDPGNRAQDRDSLLGKLLRFDTNQPGTRPELWALGLRNPWRFSFDRQTGNLYIADVGQNKREEINFQPATAAAGLNYGWRCFEASLDFNTRGCGPRAGYVFPVAEYDLTEGRCSAIGGYVYRGARYPSWRGHYFYADYCGGQLYDLWRDQAGVWQNVLAAETGLTISAFGQGVDGELYVAGHTDGVIYRLVE